MFKLYSIKVLGTVSLQIFQETRDSDIFHPGIQEAEEFKSEGGGHYQSKEINW